MRLVRLIGAVLVTILVGLLAATPAGALPPSKLTGHITDNTGALTDSGRAAVSSAIDRLYRDRRIQLWVVYVDNFSRFKPDNWAERTRVASAMGDQDALLAVATNTKLYVLSLPPTMQVLTADELNSVRSNNIEPAVTARDWSGAAVAAAEGLNKAPSSAKSAWQPIAIAVALVVVLLALVVAVLYRRRRRRLDRGDVYGNLEVPEQDLGQALARADARLRQISDYVARHRTSIGAEARTRLEEAKRHLAAAHGKQATNESEAIGYANRASALAAEAQTLANADVLGHR
ncbi:TPM domain-containing protein [Mycobacterium attenuatum]|uniref:TPM domain-containing protein n=1 Tax=Mycobacterium attenuatum TaxID=2341086 RepID=A0A498PW57_9MYCO|nr:TPM domain-containing protein [Mycobacterium attenuatum]VBA35832.1 hypothetical protein LAUMK136_01158 [Mycobacterium attenuatum]VBA48378.1 hypothetical protein LAUMK191_01158 [Mycobacterium attenuatum]VBA52641.1 hypothetical protein LAUMK41_01219 [Mycobacterium attenuatum]